MRPVSPADTSIRYPLHVQSTLLDIASGGGSIVVGGVLADGAPVAGRGWSVESNGDDELVVVVQDEPGLVAALVPDASFSVTVANVMTYQAVQCVGTIIGTKVLAGDETAAAFKRSMVFVEQVARAHLDDPEVVAAMVPHSLLAVRIREGEYFDQAPKARTGS